MLHLIIKTGLKKSNKSSLGQKVLRLDKRVLEGWAGRRWGLDREAGECGRVWKAMGSSLSAGEAGHNATSRGQGESPAEPHKGLPRGGWGKWDRRKDVSSICG